MPLHNRILDNGIQLVTEPVAESSVSAIGFWFTVGSRNEETGKTGISHFIEHLLFKGTSTYSVTDISRFFDRTGGYLNAFTERDTVCLYCVVPSYYAEQSLRILLDMTNNALLRDEDIEKERQVILSEILSSLDDPEEISADLAMNEWFPDNTLAVPVAGKAQDVSALQHADLRAWYERHFRSGPLMVCVSGSVPEELLCAILSTDTRQRPAFGRPETSAIILQSGRTVFKAPINQTHIYLSTPAAKATISSFWFPWSVLNTIIGETPGSRLFRELREDRGLCYTVYSMLSVYRGVSFWTAYLACPAGATLEAAETLLHQLEVLRREGCTEPEVEGAIAHLCGELLVSSQDAEHRMKRLARQVLAGGAVHDTGDLQAQFQAVTVDLVNSLCSDSFNSNNASLVVYGPTLKKNERKKLCLIQKKIR